MKHIYYITLLLILLITSCKKDTSEVTLSESVTLSENCNANGTIQSSFITPDGFNLSNATLSISSTSDSTIKLKCKITNEAKEVIAEIIIPNIQLSGENYNAKIYNKNTLGSMIYDSQKLENIKFEVLGSIYKSYNKFMYIITIKGIDSSQNINFQLSPLDVLVD